VIWGLEHWLSKHAVRESNLGKNLSDFRNDIQSQLPLDTIEN